MNFPRSTKESGPQIQFLCPVCDRTTVGTFLYYKAGIPITKCPECGIGKSCPDKFDPEMYYDASYFNGGKQDGYSDYIGTRDVLQKHFRRDLGLLKKLGGGTGNLLEIGCAYGYFLEVAQRQYTVSGLEIFKEAVDDCQARGLTGVKHGAISAETMESLPMTDIVVMLDVIEHLPDPREALATVTSKLRPNGLMLITTGDFSSLCAKIMGRHWRLMTPPQHLWFFTPHSLTQLTESLGFELVFIDHPFKKVPLGLIIYQICRYLSFSPHLPAWIHRFGLPVNLFDAMRIVLRKKDFKK